MPDPTPDEIVEVKLGDRTFTLRPALAELKALQKKVGGLVALYSRFGDRIVTIEDIAAIIYHGALGAGLTPPSIEALEQMVMDEGILPLMPQAIRFLAGALTGKKGASAGKAATEATMTTPPATG